MPSFYFLRLPVFLAGLIFDTRRMASSKSMSSFKLVCFFDFDFIRHGDLIIFCSVGKVDSFGSTLFHPFCR